MTKGPQRNFRLEKRTNKQLALLAGKLRTTQTEAIETAVQLLANEFLPSETSVDETRISSNEDLARQYEEVAESWASDEDLRPGLRDAVYRIHMATAEQLRKEG